MVGIPVTIEYDDAWDGLTKNLMCRCSPWNSDSGEIRTILNVGETTVVAHEVMQAGQYLHLGVEGFREDGTLVMPTTWARCGKIECGANTCEDPSADPELPIWNQLQAQLDQITQEGISPGQMDEIRACAETAAQSANTAAEAADQASRAAQSAAIHAGRAESAAQRAEEASGASQNVEWMYVTVEVEEEIPCAGITLDKSALNFNGAGQQTIVATVTPADTTDTLKWTSNNPTVAAVSNGVVTAYSNGSAAITATCGEHSATCAVEVSGISEDDTVAVTGVTLDKSTASVQVGGTVTLTATVKPDNATNKTVTWTSDNEPVATVEGGVVTGVSEGTATIGAMTADGGFSAVCNVTVAAASNFRNLFDKDTMTTANQGINSSGVISSNAWGLARVPVKENTTYSIKMVEDNTYVEHQYYTGANAGAFGFADETGNNLLSHLCFANTQADVDAGTLGANAVLSDYTHTAPDSNNRNFGWVTFTTPAGCAYLLFNTTLKNNADKIQLEEGDTIHDYYLPYNGGES